MIQRKITIDELFTKRNNRIYVITVEFSTGRVLGLNLTNKAAFLKTIETGKCHYFDDVNETIYLKGEHSREIETITEIRLDSCHARRHQLHLLYLVEMAEGNCKFGVSNCHFFKFENDVFVFDHELIENHKAVEKFTDRIEKLLTVEADIEHQKRFIKK